jgi:hypothetical protein
MKNLLVLCFVLTMLLVPAVIFAASCDSDGDPEYFIKFTFEGQEYTGTFGHPDDAESVPVATVTEGFVIEQIPDVEIIEFFGGSTESGDPMEQSFAVEVYGNIVIETPGVYVGEYDETDGFAVIWIWDGSSEYVYYPDEVTLTITSFGEIGGVIEGTFSGTFDDIMGGPVGLEPAALGDDNQSVSGSFRVKRVAEEDFPELDFFL